jgi:hypothetical protein
VPHFVFHLGTDHAVSLADNVANMVSLGIAVLLSLILLLGSRGGEQTPRAKTAVKDRGLTGSPSTRGEPYGGVETDDLAVEHLVLDDVTHQRGELL